MPSKNSETGTKKSGAKSTKRKKSVPVSQTTGTKNQDEHNRIIATAAYYRAEKRGFKGNDADAMQDWLEAEVETS
jgi:hypothetical protein